MVVSKTEHLTEEVSGSNVESSVLRRSLGGASTTPRISVTGMVILSSMK